MSSTQSTKSFLERVVPEVRSGGARNIVELAKALKIPVESTRYKVKGMFSRGLEINASVNYGKFGLTRCYATMRLSDRSTINEKRLFKLLSDYGCLTFHARTIPTNEYVCKFLEPEGERRGQIRRVLRGLVEEKVLLNSSVREVTTEKAQMIQPEFFDLKRGQWRIDWNRLRREPVAKEQKQQEETASRIEFDELDLAITRELEVDALARLSEIAKMLKSTLNNVFYHYHNHILDLKFVEEFVLSYKGGSQPNSLVQFQFDDLHASEEKVAKGALKKLPFLRVDGWSAESGFYVAQATVPQDQYLETMSYLSSSLGDSAAKLKIQMLDLKTKQEYPLPTQMFRDGKWKFDAEDSISQISSKMKR